MENKVISKEYVDKNYIHKDVIREEIKKLEEELNYEITRTEAKIQIKLLKKILEDK